MNLTTLRKKLLAEGECDIWQRDYPKLQLRTIADLLANNPFEVPQHASMYQAAQRVQRTQGRQAAFDQAIPPGA